MKHFLIASCATATRTAAWRVAVAALLVLFAAPAFCRASKVTLKDGRILEGRFAPIAGLTDDPRKQPANGAPVPQLILMCDDYLRRYFIPKLQVVPGAAQAGDAGEVLEKFTVPQRTPRAGKRVSNVADVIKIGRFDEHGRRVFTMNTSKGPADIIQGITEITPRWTKVEGIKEIWDQRIATSSIPRDVLNQILAKRIDTKNVEHRLKIARFYLQSERYADAEQELDAIVKEFPDLKEQISTVARSLLQLNARRVLAEIRVRAAAGQHEFAYGLLRSFAERFPADQVAGEILQEVRTEQEEYASRISGHQEAFKLFDEQLAAVPAGLKERLAAIRGEIHAELNLNTLDRLSAYRQLSDDATLAPAEKLALAVSGWLVGSNGATNQLTVALSLSRLRDLVRAYLVEPAKVKREQLLDEIRSLEGASPQTLAQLLAYMKPPLELPEPVADAPLMYELTVPGSKEEPVITYYVQLPPEYDPYRRYPTIITLHGEGTTPQLQIDWWAGGYDAQQRRAGQAARYGYIVIAPQWGQTAQRQYGYSAVEHLAVLNSLRDACRRFAVDTDRVYLSGHSMGGDAAWDIGLAHPDLWAGVIPIVARSDKFCNFYWENAQYVPFYVVGGELDGDKPVKNAVDLDRYLKHNFNVTVAEFLGRGHEHFSDEIQQLFDWMPRYRRDFFPKEFSCRTMRSWDNFFWWVEAREFPEAVLVDPAAWPPKRGTRPMHVDAKVTATNGLRIRCGAQQVTVWLSPEMLDLQRPIELNFNGTRVGGGRDAIQPDLAVLLEDVRTRGDRLHPFWAKIEMPSGRVNLAEATLK